MLIGVAILAVLFAVLYLLFFRSPIVSEYDADGKMIPQGSTQKAKAVLPPLVFPKSTLAIVVVVVLAQQVLLYETVLGAGWGLFIGIAGLALFFLFQKTQKTALIYSMVGAIVIASVAATFRANGFVQVVNAVFLVGVFLALIFFKTYQKISWNGIWLLKYGLLLIPETIRHFFRVLSQAGSTGLKTKKSSSFSVVAIVKTIALTLLVLAVFVGLLSKADPVFAQIIRDVWESAIGRVVSGILVSIVVLLVASFSLKTSKEEEFNLNFFSFWDVFIPVLATGVLFGVFLFVQAQYLFGGANDLALFDLTYSEYVRKGFIELMWASLFGSLLTYFVYMKNELLSDARQKQALKIVTVLFSAELALLVGSAFKRNLLYIDAFGLTRVRIVGNFFLAWLIASVLLLLAMSLIKKMQEKHFLTGMWIVSLAVVFGLNVINIDALVFASAPDLEDAVEGKTKDYFYLANLSEDVAQEWVPMVMEIEQQVTALKQKPEDREFTESELQRMANAKLALVSLKQRWNRLDKKYGEATDELPKYLFEERKMASIKFGELRGYKVMAQEKELYADTLDTLISDIDSLVYDSGEQDLFGFEQTLLFDYRRPFISTDVDYYPTPKETKIPPSPAVVPSVIPSAQPVLDEDGSVLVQ